MRRQIVTGIFSQAIGLSIARVAAMFFSLVAVTLTYHQLSETDFALFNMTVFLIAVGSALSQPLNRIFWAGNTEENFSLTSYGALVLTVTVVLPGVLISLLARGYPGDLGAMIAMAATFYGGTRVVERYAYGRLLVANFPKTSISPILAFAVAEVGIAGAMLISGNSNVSLRLGGPPALFLVIATLFAFLSSAPNWAGQMPKVKDLLNFIRRHTMSRLGLNVIFTGALMTAAGMIDRPLLYLFPFKLEGAGASYLLALSYSVAIQTLLLLLLDMARSHVYRNDDWLPGARHASNLIIAFAVALVLLSAAVYPALIMLHLLPPDISWLLWIGLLSRSLALALTTILNVDRFQVGRVKEILGYGSTILFIAMLSIFLLYSGLTNEVVGAISLMCYLTLCGLLIVKFYARVPAL